MESQAVSGRDFAKRAVAGIRTYLARALVLHERRVSSLQRAVDEMQSSVSQLKEEIEVRVQRAVASIEAPKGEKGDPGKSVSVDDVAPIIEAAVARWEVSFERHAQQVLMQAVAQAPKPQDGEGVEDIAVETEGRNVAFAFKFSSGRVVTKTIRVETPLYKGIWSPSRAYEKSDFVTYEGSAFIARRDTNKKPGDSDDWRMFVKRGRDGRDAAAVVVEGESA